jgi:hypothetical protein
LHPICNLVIITFKNFFICQSSIIYNPVTPDPNNQSARVESTGTLNNADIIKRMMKRGSTVTEPDANAVILLYNQEVIDALSEGYSVNTDIFNARASVQGVFNNINDNFDASRHTVRASISAGNVLFSKMLSANVEKVSTSIVSPDIIDFNDLKTNTNSQATKGGIGTITGSELKFDNTNVNEGIFFVNTTSNAETKVTDVAIRTEGKLMFIIPTSLVAGTYTVEVRKAYTNAKTIRVDAFDNLLTVV